MSEIWKPRKVVIVGAGAVGSTFAYALAQNGSADEIVLSDANRELAMGQALDLAHGQAFFPSVQLREAQTGDYGDAHLICHHGRVQATTWRIAPGAAATKRQNHPEHHG